MGERPLHEIRAAVVGSGFIGPVHVEALRRLGIPVTGILGSSPEKSRAARDRLGLPAAYDSFEEVLEDGSAEAVHLAVPNVLHFEMAARALRAGKHVLCEKPLAMDARQSAELVRIAESSGLHAGTAYNVRFYPLNVEARERVARGDAGRVLFIHGSYFQDWLLQDTDYNWRVLAEEGGELRAVADVGTHWIDLLTWITGLRPQAVLADLLTVHPVRRRPRGEVETFSGKAQEVRREALEPVDVRTDDCGSVLLRFHGGARGSLQVSQVSAGRKNSIRWELAGARASLAWDSESPERLWIGRRERPNEVLFRDPALMGTAARRFADYPGGHVEGYPDTFKGLFRAFYGAIAAGPPAGDLPYPTFRDGHREIVLCDAVLKSHRESRWVEIEE